MNNISIIIEAALMEGIWTPEQVEEYITAGEGLPLKTFAEWKKAGYVVKKGESAVLKTRLWQMKKKKKSREFIYCTREATNAFQCSNRRI